MEFIRGEKLSDVLTRRRSVDVARPQIATEVAEVSRARTRSSVVHRDVKPANVMITEEGHAKIIDFG